MVLQNLRLWDKLSPGSLIRTDCCSLGLTAVSVAILTDLELGCQH